MRKSPIPPSLPLIFPFLEGNYKYLHLGAAGKRSFFIYQSFCYFSSVFFLIIHSSCTLAGFPATQERFCSCATPRVRPSATISQTLSLLQIATLLLNSQSHSFFLPFSPWKHSIGWKVAMNCLPQDLVSPVLNQHALGALAFPDIPLWQ